MPFRIDLSANSALPPIRSDLFSADRLEEHARSLAKAQPVGKTAGQFTTLPRQLRQNVSDLTENFLLLAKAAKAGNSITSAGEWFLDNFHIVEEQARQVQRDLPPSFYRELPKLSEGPLMGFPRVYGIAWAIAAHTDSGFDAERLERFVNAYQQVAPLKIGELWAIAITLRLILVENLKRLTDRVVVRVRESDRADAMTAQALDALGGGSGDIAARAVDRMTFSPAALARFEQQLREKDSRGERILQFVEGELAAQGISSQDIIHDEYQAQSADDISVRNVITSMRLVSDIDWTEFFEAVSLVNGALSESVNFRALDFTTRDRYRQSIERLARRSPFDEIQIARMAVEQTEQPDAQTVRQRDVGFYLIGKGCRLLEQKVRYAPSARRRLMRTVSAWGIWGYISALGVLTLVLLALLLAAMAHLGVPAQFLAVLGFLAVVPASELAVALVNRMATDRWRPEILPALALKDGVPDALGTVLVVPILLGSESDIAEQIERLEVHYFANGDAGLQFILLSDWVDSDTERSAQDDRLLDFASQGIAALNRQHAGDKPLFLLLHRRRLWNPAQQRWLGWERKRGKLHEFNRLLRGATDTSFIDTAAAQLKNGIRYVITLDADTRLPRGAAKRLIGKMAHPLNQPDIDPVSGCVTSGHGILQPRVTPSLPIGTESSLFQWAFSGPNGLDPYAFAVSDVYQDLFDEGSFVGKGIYDVDAFERALEGRIRENTVLSHDLLEGVFARAALVSDVEVVEEFPSRYDVEVSRQHRWVRGDWQLLPWIFCRSGISMLGRWKMLDNMRRSLAAPALLLSFLVGWLLPPPAALAWTVFLALVIALPPLLPIAAGVLPRQRGYSIRSHMRSLARDTVLAMTQLLFTVTFMARLAFLALDAIIRTMFRLFVSRRNLLQWVTFAQSAYSRRAGWGSTILQLTGSVSFVLGASALIGWRAMDNLWPAAPFMALWGFSPVMARWASQSPRVEPHLEMSDADRKALRVAARRTWMFFETFVTAQDNMLPPDNFQEDPTALIAHRTSPTNIGGYLCSILAAHDLGWIGTAEAVDRLEASFASLQNLERFRGHFLNWYDTTTLRALEPRYVSTVDSGNLAGNLIVVKNACEELTRPPPGDVARAGLGDGLAILQETAQAISDPHLRANLEPRIAHVARLLEGDGPLANDLLADMEQAAQAMSESVSPAMPSALRVAAASFLGSVKSHARPVDSQLAGRLAAIAALASQFVSAMEFGFLFDEARQLLSIGYRLEDQARDSNAYDLLASEARLASFLAIAKGDIPTRHWFRLGRTLTPLGRIPALQSWSGSMFEYLMPSLIMHEPTGSLLNLSNRAAVRRQIRYAAPRHIPWGISESQYNARDREQNYQYSGFGVPDLGIKRGLGENTVVAPYATGLAAMVAPMHARRNLDRLTKIGALGDYGWYEAIDYTPARLPENADHVLIRSYMAHHQGMMILGLADVLNDGAMRERFHAEPMVQAAELLLQERMPRDVSVARLPPSLNTGAITYYDAAPRGPRTYSDPDTDTPRTHLLSNSSYSVMLTVAGSGFSQWQGQAITRWREDGTRDPWGSFIYLRDLRDGRTWSAGYQPVGAAAEDYSVEFSEDRASIRRRDGVLETLTELTVSPEDDSEVRRITITNHGTRLREIEVTSYMELALAAPRDDDAHPAFSKLFVQTEYLTETGALIATRRARSPSDKAIWSAHLSVVDGESVGDVQYETDRARFLTRNKSARSAGAIMGGWPLSNSAGATLDPCFSLRRRVQVPRGKSVSIAFWTMAAGSRKEILDLVDRHHDGAAFDRAMTLAATYAQSQLQHLGISGDEPHLFQLLANAVIYMDASLRAPPEILARVAPAQSALWPFGISGDLPIVLVRLQDEEQIPLVRQIVRAREYLRVKGVAFDLVILNERASSYAQELQKALEGIIHANDRAPDDGLGRIQLVRADLAGSDGVAALRAVARVDLSGRRGSLEQQLAASGKDSVPKDTAKPPIRPVAGSPDSAELLDQELLSDLHFFNSYGGFSADGREYVTVARAGRPTPAPWINVIANPDFGFQVSTEGAGFCWAANSQQNQITPWSNDPVTNESGDFLYLKDLDSGELWSPVSTPIAHPSCTYVARHGQGYTKFACSGLGLTTEMVQFLPRSDGVRISRLRIRNTSATPRRLAVTQYVSWALGAAGAARPFIQTWMEPETQTLLARNPWNADFGGRVAFLDMGGRQTSWTTDRREFLGRNGAYAAPSALVGGKALSGKLGPGLDACAVQQTELEIAPGEETELVILLGQGRDGDAAKALVDKYRHADLDSVFAEVIDFWDETLGAIQVRTPEPAMDLLINRWLLYQTLSCRMWGRAGFYQVSGAYGFRDQLQDCMAMCVSRPELAREQILRAAARQFEEGDVQHWWLPESGKGIRTRISDDKAWLGYVTAHYIETTQDFSILDEQLPFLTAPVLKEGEHDAFSLPQVTHESASLYEHCARALDASRAVGVHELPLMGTGDWNDGMNRVGEQGKGESVWLGWFLHATMQRFLPYAEARRDAPRVADWLVHMDILRKGLETNAWDGAWYRRAYFDDGFALGSAANRECRIDSIAQSWSVISGVAPRDKAVRAMEAVDRYLVRTEDRLMTLFTPPFVESIHDPGYIKGYPAGIRENGGQYTHGVLWSIVAYTMLGEGDRAGELFAMLNPVNHARSQTQTERYRVEPYVACGDVYSVPPHVGRGGWTWYSGSAAWMYRVAVEDMLGLRLAGDRLLIAPVIPRAWPKFEATLRRGAATYNITVENPQGRCSGVSAVFLDGKPVDFDKGIVLAADGAIHEIRAVLGETGDVAS